MGLSSRARRLFAALFGGCGLVSCARPQTRAETISIQISAAEAKSGVFGGEQESAEIAVVAPSFAGFYYSAPYSDTLVVAVANMDDADRAKEAVAALWLRRKRGPANQPIVVRRVRYSFLQLHRWRSTVEKGLLALPQVSMVDLDEAKNTVTVGVIPNSDRNAVHHLMRSAGLPTGAYRIIRFGPVKAFEPGFITESSTPAR